MKSCPHWPCGTCIFKYKEKPRDWLQSGWAFNCVESKRNPTYNAQFNVKKCLGTIECEICEAQTRPIIKNHGKKIEEQISKGCSVPTCNGMLNLIFNCTQFVVEYLLNFFSIGTLKWIKCAASCKFIQLEQLDNSGYCYYILHSGHHHHKQCIQTKPFNNEKDQLRKRIQNAPETLPKKLVVGQSLDEHNSLASVRNISEAFTNSDRVRYYHRTIIEEGNIITKTAHRHEDNFVLDILQFQIDHPDFIRKVDFINKGIIILQSDWMQEQGFSIIYRESLQTVLINIFPMHFCYLGM